MANWLQRLKPKSAFARGVGVLVGGTAGAQLLSVLAAPLLTRLYTPEDFGLLAVYASLLGLITIIASLRYELAIPLPEDDTEAANVAALSMALVGVCTLFSGVLVLLLREPIADALGVPTLARYLWLLPVGVLLAGTYNIFNYWSVRTKRFAAIAGTRVRQTLATIVIQLAAFKFGAIALLFGQVAGQTVGTTSLGRAAVASSSFSKVSWHGITIALKRYRRFPIFSSPEAFVNTAANQLPSILFAAYFGPAAVGLYTLSQRVLALPMSVVGSAVSQVFLSDAPKAYRDGTLGALVKNLHSKLAFIAIPPTLLLISLGPSLFEFVFGKDWRQAGEIARWIAPWIYFQFVSSPLSTVFAVREKLKEAFIFQLSSFFLRLAAILIGIWINDFLIAIIIFSFASSICYIALLFWTMLLSGNRELSAVYPDIKACIYGLLCFSPIIAAVTYEEASLNIWIAAATITTALNIFYYLLLFKKAINHNSIEL